MTCMCMTCREKRLKESAKEKKQFKWKSLPTPKEQQKKDEKND